MQEWDEIADKAWDRSEQSEATMRSYKEAYEGALEYLEEAIAARDGGAMRRFRQAADSTAPGIEELLPTFLLLAMRVNSFLDEFQDEARRLDVMTAVTVLAYVAGFNTAEGQS